MRSSAAKTLCPTPRKGGPERVVAALEKAMDDIVQKAGISPNDLTAIGLAVPGVVDPDRGLVVIITNMPFDGRGIGGLLEARFKAPIVIGNDGNFGESGRHLARLGPQRSECHVHLVRA